MWACGGARTWWRREALVSRTRSNALSVAAQSRDPRGTDCSRRYRPRLSSAPPKWRCAASGARERRVLHALSTSSLRAQRSNPESLRGDSLDCFATLAMTECVWWRIYFQLTSQLPTQLPVLAAHFARALLRLAALLEKGRREGRAPAGTRDPCAGKMHTGWITGDAGRPAFPARMVLTVSFVLSPGSDALSPPSPCGRLMRAPGRAATSPQGLTHRLRASGPHDFSVRGRPHRTFESWRVLTPDADEAAVTAPCRAADRNVSRGLPALPSRRAPALPRPPHPGLRIVTIANAPLTGQDGNSDTTKPKFGK